MRQTPKMAGSAKSMVSDQVQCVRIGARMPPEARRYSPVMMPSRIAAKASITLPVAAVAIV